MKTSLHYRDNRSDKLYVVEIQPQPHVKDRFQVVAAWGRRGGTLQTGTKADMLRADEAQRWHDQLVKEKIAKGYHALNGDAPRVQSPNELKAVRPDDSLPALMLLNEVDALTADELLDDPDWLLEPKFDGVRVKLTRAGDQVSGISRTNKPVALPQAVVEAAMGHRARRFVIDGELIGETFVAFDALSIETPGDRGRDLEIWRESARDRIQHVHRIFDRTSAIVPTVYALTGAEKKRLYRSVFERGMEGADFKEKSAAYSPGRPNTGGPALKYKFVNTASVICSGQHGAKSSFEMQLADGTEIGTCTVPPNKTMPRRGEVVEVRYLYVHDVGGKLIQSVFLGVREDVGPEDCTAKQLRVKGAPRS